MSAAPRTAGLPAPGGGAWRHDPWGGQRSSSCPGLVSHWPPPSLQRWAWAASGDTARPVDTRPWSPSAPPQFNRWFSTSRLQRPPSPPPPPPCRAPVLALLKSWCVCPKCRTSELPSALASPLPSGLQVPSLPPLARLRAEAPETLDAGLGAAVQAGGG
eukprot:CAMPEP_0118961808 /NCGR_PEP_ID=MMETSP1173-20130426/370_1 /TAXON_ID=1034831 /ORGANISM="Rhizochromulina marina cf, Strain CCMP1243" /LENGTH=158 /DNA_ID=CAMNT_0006909999 /DNA_START=125 /DNA_END=599 /DNA_ORIENTATION=+